MTALFILKVAGALVVIGFIVAVVLVVVAVVLVNSGRA